MQLRSKNATFRSFGLGAILAMVAAGFLTAVLVTGWPSAARSETEAPVPAWSIGFLWPFGNPPLPISAIDWNALTHIVHYAAVVNADGTLDLETEQISKNAAELVAAAHRAGVKALLGVMQANWAGQKTTLELAAINHRSELVSNIMKVVKAYHYDGVEVDWEPLSRSGMKALAPELRAALGHDILIASATVDEGKFWNSVYDYFDRVNIMTYDLTGGTNSYTWHNAALYSADETVWSVDMAVKRFRAAGVPAAKIGIGIPFYGYRSTGGGVSGPRQNRLTTPSVQSIPYQSLVSLISPQTYKWDSAAEVPYLSISSGMATTTQFISYDNEQSVMAKVQYVKDHNLGGWIIWHLQADYLPRGAVKHPLSKAIAKARGANP